MILSPIHCEDRASFYTWIPDLKAISTPKRRPEQGSLQLGHKLPCASQAMNAAARPKHTRASNGRASVRLYALCFLTGVLELLKDDDFGSCLMMENIIMDELR